MTKHSRTIQTSQDELLRYLEEGSPFALWNPVEKRELVRNAHDIHLSQGQALYRQGDTAKYVYFVVSGSVKVFVSSVDGDEAVLLLIMVFTGLDALGSGNPASFAFESVSSEPHQVEL